ncbi:MAG: kynureninase [Candidatus Puniceispirillaceae bacterium]
MTQSLPMKEHFHLPDGVIYLDGNSLGPLPNRVRARAQHVIETQWADGLITSWNKAGWMDLPRAVGDKIAPLIGAEKDSVRVGDTLSIQVYSSLSAAIKMRPERRIILSDQDNFPSDLYMAQGLVELLGQGYELRLIEVDKIGDALSDDVAVVLLTQVDYRTGRLYDMAGITRLVQAHGAVMIWDLAHSAGALPVDLQASGPEFAVGCTYKYLNAGPGAPAFIYVHPDIAASVQPALSGWMGHASPFDMSPDYQPADGAGRLRIGTPPVVQMAMLDAALDLWDEISLDEIRAASLRLSGLFIKEVEARCPEFTLASPRDPKQRGSQVSFAFKEGYAFMQALIAHSVIGDFRPPDLMRFGFTPLYLDEGDILQALEIIEEVYLSQLWRDPAFQKRQPVT